MGQCADTNEGIIRCAKSLRSVVVELCSFLSLNLKAPGCLLFCTCYFKSVFVGESKLQALNDNYLISDSPKYSSTMTDLIRDMLNLHQIPGQTSRRKELCLIGNSSP